MPRQLHSIDRLFLDIETEDHSMGVMPLYFYDPVGLDNDTFSYDQFVEHVDNCIRTIPMLYGKLHRVAMDLENPYLVEDRHFDVHNHISHRSLQNPTCIKELSKAITDFQEKPIDTNRPLWEMMVISGLNVKTLPKDGFMVAMKIHHAVADGMTVMDLTGKLHGVLPIGEPAVLKPSSTLNSGGLLGSATRILASNVKQALGMVKPLLKIAPQMSMSLLNFGFEQIQQDSEKIAHTRFADKVGPQRVWGYSLLDINELNRIRSLFPSTTINDLVLTVIAGGLREYLKDKNELPDCAMRALAPINVRTEKESSHAGNEISLMSLTLPVQVEDPLERLLVVNRFSSKAKATQNKLGSRNISELTKNLPAAYLTYVNRALGTSSAQKIVGRLGNTVITNVPGPSIELNLLGARLVRMAGTAPIGDGVGLFHAVASYNGQISINASSCPEMIPDIKFYIDCLNRSYQHLLMSVEERYLQAQKA